MRGSPGLALWVSLSGAVLLFNPSDAVAQGNAAPPGQAGAAQSQPESPPPPPRYWSVRPSLGELGESPVPDRIASTQSAPAVGAAPALRPEFVIAPIPIINPTLDNGMALAVGELYPLDRNSPPSGTLGMGFYTSSHSWA